MREGDIYVVLGCCLKSCEESGRFCQRSGSFCEFRSQQPGRLCKPEGSSQRGFVSLEISNRGGFGSLEAGVGRLGEFSSEESGKSVEVEARSRGESKRPVVE